MELNLSIKCILCHGRQPFDDNSLSEMEMHLKIQHRVIFFMNEIMDYTKQAKSREELQAFQVIDVDMQVKKETNMQIKKETENQVIVDDDDDDDNKSVIVLDDKISQGQSGNDPPVSELSEGTKIATKNIEDGESIGLDISLDTEDNYNVEKPNNFPELVTNEPTIESNDNLTNAYETDNSINDLDEAMTVLHTLDHQSGNHYTVESISNKEVYKTGTGTVLDNLDAFVNKAMEETLNESTAEEEDLSNLDELSEYLFNDESSQISEALLLLCEGNESSDESNTNDKYATKNNNDYSEQPKSSVSIDFPEETRYADSSEDNFYSSKMQQNVNTSKTSESAEKKSLKRPVLFDSAESRPKKKFKSPLETNLTNNKTSKEKKKRKCDRCNKMYASKSGLKSHVCRVSQSQTQSDLLNIKVGGESLTKKYEKNIGKSFNCSDCDKSFTSEHGEKIHRSRMHSDTSSDNAKSDIKSR